MKWLFHFILSHSIFIAFCAAALSLQTLQLLSLQVDGYLLAFIFFAALAAYNAYWILSSFSYNRPIPLLVFLQKRSSSFVVFFVACAGMAVCFLELHLVLYNLIFAAILLAVYSLPVMPFKQMYFMRKAGVLKTIILAFAWAVITTLVPLQISIVALRPAELMVFATRFFFMLMLCIIFDKRDAAVDKIRGLQSLATEIKLESLHYFFAIVLTLYACSSYLLSLYEVSIPQRVALLLAGLIAGLVYIASFKRRGYFFYYFLVDGLMFFSALLTAIAHRWLH